jgi:hypothetical protein
MNASPIPCNSIPDSARQSLARILSKYGIRWLKIRRPYVQIIRTGEDFGYSTKGILETARKFERIAIEEKLEEVPEFIMAAAVEVAEGSVE